MGIFGKRNPRCVGGSMFDGAPENAPFEDAGKTPEAAFEGVEESECSIDEVRASGPVPDALDGAEAFGPAVRVPETPEFSSAALVLEKEGPAGPEGRARVERSEVFDSAPGVSGTSFEGCEPKEAAFEESSVKAFGPALGELEGDTPDPWPEAVAAEVGAFESQPTEQVPLVLRWSVRSQRGPRVTNDDYAMGASRHFALSDGIGGASLGEAMSRAACVGAFSAFEADLGCIEAFRSANEAVIRVKEMTDCPDSGATLLLAEQRGTSMDFAWAGDSVAYLLRNGELELLTEVGRTRAGSNELDGAVGYSPALKPRTKTVGIELGDRFLLCSDGVWEALGRDELRGVLAESFNAVIAAEELVDRAVECGHDNATVVVIYVESGGSVLRRAAQSDCGTPEVGGF